jgi:O-succinylbenzoic acid--CoA ligase
MRVVLARPELLLPALEGALAGGEPVLPVPTDPAAAARVIAALRPDEPLEHADTCLVVPTSGSTGVPKGVLLTADQLRASAFATLDRLGGPGTWDLQLPVTHIGGIQVLVRGLLATGPRRYTALVPTQLRRALAAGAPPTAYDAVLLGGAAADPTLLEAAAAAGVRVVTTYGMSETAGGCVYDGVPLDGVTVDVADRIRLTGPVVAQGYRLRPDLTAESFVDGTFVTGDVGVLEGARLRVLGRADDLIITGGENVAPLAVEAALREHPAVVDVAVLGVPDEEWGQRVVAVVVLRAPLDLAAARDHVAARRARVAAPRQLVGVDTIPLLATGKPDRAALRALALR